MSERATWPAGNKPWRIHVAFLDVVTNYAQIQVALSTILQHL